MSVVSNKRNTQFTNEFSKEVWEQTYKFYTDEDINDSHMRVASDLALAEKEENRDYWTEKFLDVLENFQFVPGGRILSNAGTQLTGTTMINCFCSGFSGEKQDSINSIIDEVRRQALILKSEGGYGFCVDVLRPRGAFIHAIANESPGTVKFLDIWDVMSGVITSGSGKKKSNIKGKDKIRKGAMMVTESCWHPDIEEFITAKQTPGKLTKFNMSVLATDEFMDAVINHLPWRLEFPDYEFLFREGRKMEYNQLWDGDLKGWKEKGLPVKIYKEFKDANELWDLIMKSAYNRNEPGILFVDTINRLNNLHYLEHISTTNPCIPGDSLVATDQGLLPFQNLVRKWEAQNVIQCLTNDITSGQSWSVHSSNIVKVHRSGTREVLRVHLSNGMIFEATPDHKVWTTEGYVPTQDLQGKKIQLNSDYKFNEDVRLPFNVTNQFTGQNSRQYSANLPTQWTEDLGLILGWATGDGWRTGRQLGLIFGKDDAQMIEKVKDIYDKWDLHYSTVIDSHNSTTLYVGAWIFNNFLDSIGFIKCKAHGKRVPQTIFQAPKKVVAAFLRGLFSADGSVLEMVRSNYWVSLCSTSKELLNDVQQLLLMFGMTHHTVYRVNKESTFNYTTVEGEQKEYKGGLYYDLRIFGKSILTFLEEIGFSLDYKQERLNALKNKRFKKKSSIVEVVQIEGVGLREVFDLTESQNHSFIVSGITVSNCGEQPLPKGGVCLLGSFNLTQFINSTGDNWDYDKLKEIIPVVVRMMDNVNDRTKVPLPEQQENIKNKRRMGLGVVGYASALMIMKVRYGSPKALQITNELMEFISNQTYQASALLSKEKGCFPLFSLEKFLQGDFVKNLDEETKALIKEHGLRNSHLLSIQPTGNTSSLANNISGGLEPIIFNTYIRTAAQPWAPDGLDVPRNVEWENKTFESTSQWEWKKEGDENLLVTNLNDEIWKFDRNRGLVKEVSTCDYAVKYLMKRDEWDSKAEWAACSSELNINDHLNTMKVFAKHLDGAISKTINVPKNYSYEEFKNLYTDAYKAGTIKGCTVYREGTMATVLASHSITEQPTRINKTVSPKRPQVLPCDIHHTTAASKKWVVLVGLLESDPYEVFAFQPKNVTLPVRIKKGNLVKIKGNGYNLECEDGWVLQDINTLFESDEHEALTRMISTALRHGTDIEFIVAQLMKSKGTVTSFGRAIGRTLKTYIQNYKSLKCLNPQCRSKNLVRENGCPKCLDCGFSGCG